MGSELRQRDVHLDQVDAPRREGTQLGKAAPRRLPPPRRERSSDPQQATAPTPREAATRATARATKKGTFGTTFANRSGQVALRLLDIQRQFMLRELC